jgi:lipopolysaccharide transport system permease protein
MSLKNEVDKGWTWEIKPQTRWFRLGLAELWNYRHLLLRIVRRDFLIHHQQTLLGPLWILFQPLIVLVLYVLVFEKAVGLSTDGLPSILFYLSGIILWTFFSECFTGTAFTFINNGQLFGKIYFPRMVMPLASVLGNLVRFGIHFSVFIVALLFWSGEFTSNSPMTMILTILFALSVSALFGMGLGLIFAIFTAKYRDLVNLIHTLVRLMMFATPIIYPLSAVDEKARFWVKLNPLCSVVECFRFGFLGKGTFSIYDLQYSVLVALFVFFVGQVLFNKYANKLQDFA